MGLIEWGFLGVGVIGWGGRVLGDLVGWKTLD